MSKKEIPFKKYFSAHYKKIAAITIISAVAAVLLASLWSSNRKQVANDLTPVVEASGAYQTDIVYYCWQGNVYCKNVEKFIAENKIETKITFAKKEVWMNGSNDMEMKERAIQCGLKPEKTGVPMIWSEGKCYVGQVEVENFLKKEAGL